MISSVKAAPEQHYWPHEKGVLGHLSQTQYGPPAAVLDALDDSLAWKWVHPTNLSAFVWGTLIDKNKNIIIAAMQGIFKYTSDGELLWAREDISGTQMPTLMGDALYGMTSSAMMYALDLWTGETIWQRQEGDMVEAHNGVLVGAVGRGPWYGPPGVGLPA